MRVRPASLSISLCLFLLSFAQIANSAPLTREPSYSATMLVAGTETTDAETAWLGLDVRLSSGWHTYWRSAGDAGAPPEFDWAGSRNVEEVTVEWPAPRRFSDAGIDTFGYADRVLFPIKIRLREAGETAHVALKLALYVCSTICTRNDLQFEADIKPGSRFADKQGLIDEWRNKVPRSQSPSLSIRSVRLEPGSPARLRIAAVAAPPLAKPDVFIDGDNGIVASRPTFTQGYSGASFISVPLEGFNGHADKPIHVTIVDGDRSIEAVIPQSEFETSGHALATPTVPSKEITTNDSAHRSDTSVWSMFALSLLGGLILNFMPCVFPVLSLKLFSLMGHSTQDAHSIRARFLASAAGVVASFLILATVLAAMKTAGAQIGWGIQFQQPLFLIGMAAILVAVSANLLGLYEVRLPWWLARMLGNHAGGHSLSRSFLNGFVMTLLATPCSAPFVGTAVAFALSQNALQIFEIFLGLGIGMASPFIVLAAVPRVGQLFPRPGHWMLTVRHFAAAAMAATSIWLLTVLAQVSGASTALLVGGALGILTWMLAVSRRRFANTIAGVLIIGLTGLAVIGARTAPWRAPDVSASDIHWTPLVSSKIREMVANGHTVFVDIGAAWCVTCKVNEALIVNSERVRERLTSDVVPVKGDWTRPNEAIAAYLQSFGRFGLPFNVVFGPRAPGGILLPELLTQADVLNAFNAASARNASN